MMIDFKTIAHDVSKKCELQKEVINKQKKEIESLQKELAEFKDPKKWSLPYNYLGKLIPEHALYIPKIKKGE